jgi:hypothetical protein
MCHAIEEVTSQAVLKCQGTEHEGREVEGKLPTL